jgi:ketosteroid isomerase-like protein
MATTAQHANIQRSRRAYEAFATADMKTVGELMADDVVWHVSGNNPISGEYKGKDAVFGFFGKLMQLTGGTFKLEVHDILANDDHSVTLVRETAEIAGKKWDGKSVHISHPDSEGRVKEFWSFSENQTAADDFFKS